ncbi:hypothetical protein [Chryseobacterium ureilyticum]|uniref:hypothetical protein n=1 Tax=Chryseobacterium ureilyticum TaxID=373668 RepID=UPI001115627F|nr:hypothetical protein [Chryseobacterium ureilyticum]
MPIVSFILRIIKNYKHLLIRFISLAIPYFLWFAMFAEAGYKRQTYDLDMFPLDLFFLLAGLIGLETFYLIYRKQKKQYVMNILLLIFFTVLYFVLPHRDNFN